MDTAMPLQLLQPLDSNNPASTPVRLSGPEQRLTVTPDPGVGDESLLPPSQLLISKGGESRSIWPVHLAGWQALGWQLDHRRCRRHSCGWRQGGGNHQRCCPAAESSR